MKRPRPRVFLCYAHADKAKVRRIAEGLRRYEIEIWLDEDQLLPGQSVAQGVEEALQEADFVIYFVSHASLDSRWVRTEVNQVFHDYLCGNDSRLLPVKLDGSTPPPILRDLVNVDLSGEEIDEGVQTLARSILRTFAFAPRSQAPQISPDLDQNISDLSRQPISARFHWFIISGASCSGKDVLAHVMDQRLTLRLGITVCTKYTTRARRHSEPQYVAHLSEADFGERVANSALLFPYVKRHHRYGFDREEFRRSIRDGIPLISIFTDFLLVPKIAGAMKAANLPTTTVFIEAPKPHLQRRVLFRNLPSDEVADRARSIDQDFLEIQNRPTFRSEYVFIYNGDDRPFVNAADELAHLIEQRLSAKPTLMQSPGNT